MNNPRSGQPLFPGMKPSSAGPSRQRDSSTVAAGVNPQDLFLSWLSDINDVTARVCRRHRLNADEAEEFRSEVHIHFIERDYERVRCFQGLSTRRTYLTVVITRVYLDHRNQMWGKWRPSAEAKRLGPQAILIERHIGRDGWTVDQVVEMFLINHHETLAEELLEFCWRVSQRPSGRKMVPDSEADGQESPEPPPDVNVLRAEENFRAKRARNALYRALQALTPEDRLILKLLYEKAMSVADIARALHLNQKRLYRRIERLKATLRRDLEDRGISRDRRDRGDDE